MADMVFNLGRNILNKGKGKTPATDLHEHNDDLSSTGRSSDQSPLFVGPDPQTTDSEQPGPASSKRQRPSEQIAELQREQKRARTAAITTEQFAGPPRPSAEDVVPEDEGVVHQPGRRDRRAVTRQPGNQTQETSNAAGKEADGAPSRVAMDPLQGSSNAHPGQPGPRATPSAGPANATVYLTVSDDEDEENNGVSPGESITPRTGIKAPHSEFSKAIRAQCSMKCEAAALTLSRRTDEEGKHIFHRCFGTAALVSNAKNLSIVRTLMANDVRHVLADANATLSRRRDKYNRYFEGEDDSLQKLELKKILDRQDARVEKVEQTRNWRKDMVNDLREMPPRFFGQNI
ncbi:hypothetical protein MBLNU13_g02432t1 [Cladosporium sp. NU13]